MTAAHSAAAACPTSEDREHLLDTAHKLSMAAIHVLNTVQELKNKDKMYGRGGAGGGLEFHVREHQCVCMCCMYVRMCVLVCMFE